SPLRSQAVQHDRDHADAEHRFARFRVALIVPALTPEPQPPTERSLDHPTLRQVDPTLNALRPPHDPQLVQPPPRDFSEQRLGPVPAIGPDHPPSRQQLQRQDRQQVGSRVGVRDAGPGDQHGDQQPQTVYHQMPLAAGDLLAGVVADFPTSSAPFDRLTIQVGGAWRAFAARLRADLLAQDVIDFQPDAVLAPLAEVVVGGGPGWIVLGQGAPLAAGAVDVEDSVDDVVEVDGARPPTRLGLGQEWFKTSELCVGQVAGIIGGSHASLYARATLFVQALRHWPRNRRIASPLAATLYKHYAPSLQLPEPYPRKNA